MLYSKLETQNRDYDSGVIGFADSKTEAVCKSAHRKIFRKNVGNNFLEFLVATH